ncbi:hypothetical protein C7B65_04185 [Phormidesmis priestleyi ULC007]|uniref:CHAT domain-containing protein n=1 Tax=Phormidesmis priestleyi ULC007 TaxID=1920490 RepID=A0A2T1DKY8_9CYAN|nr:CHAT domain-containing protein [Phormidesmis priestleyi]PSB21146.1 hypothetical protein C7B65_04185 [Phormidesmis priestleyi ULC007]PZO51329.1 MAG: CHAT domain-containing protein [Phormidesmis priestleyi]
MRERIWWNPFSKIMRSHPALIAGLVLAIELLGHGAVTAQTPQLSPSPVPSAKPAPSPSPEPRVLIAEVAVSGADGKLRDEVYKAIKTKPGGISTRSQLQQDINAVFATGFFSNVKATPEDTPLGVRVTFEVKLNPVLRSVSLKGATLLPKTIVETVFQPQYGKITNLRELQAGIQKVNKWYTDNGYVLAQVVDTPQVAQDGTVTLTVAEGVIEAIQVRYVDKDGNDRDAKGNPIRGKTPASVILQQVRSKPGDVFDRSRFGKDLPRISNVGFDDVKLSLAPGQDPRKVIVVVNVTNNDDVEQAINLGSRVEAENTDEARRRALTHYQTALKLAQARQDLLTEAFTVNRIAKVYYDLEEYSQTLDFFNRSLVLSKRLTLPVLEATTLTNIANVYYNLEEFQQAFDFYNQSISIWQVAEKSSDQDIDITATFAAGISSTKGKFIELYFSPNRLFEKNENESNAIGARSIGKAVALFRIGDLYQLLGDYPQALYAFNESRKLLQNTQIQAKKESEKLVLEMLEVFNLTSVSGVYADLDDRYQADTYIDLSQKRIASLIPKFLKDSEQFSTIFISLFSALPESAVRLDSDQQTGFSKQRRDFFNQFTSLLKGTSGQPISASIINIFGDSYIDLGQPQEALKIYEQALQIGQSSKDDSSKTLTLASTYKSIGKAQSNLGNYRSALDTYNQSLKLLQTLNNSLESKFEKAETLNLKGKSYLQLRQFSQARKMYNQALTLAQQIKNASQVTEAWLGLAGVNRAEGNLAQAQTEIEAALTLLEDYPLKPGGSNLNLKFSVSRSGQSNTWIDRSATPSVPKPSEFKFYKALTSYFASKRNYYEFYINLLMQRYRQTGNKQYEALALQASERSHARSLSAMLGRSDRTADPRYQQLTQPPQLKEIQQQILDNDTMLLEYSLGEERSYLWAVTKTEISSYELPKRSVIEAVAKDFYDYLTVPSLRLKPSKTANAGLALSRLVLAPIAEKLGKKRLVIVGDGLLQYIPFSALPSSTGALDPLLTNHEIVSLPSASTLTLIRRDRANRPVPKKTLAVLADPVFDRSDDRFSAKLKETLQSLDLEQIYPRLPGTRTQVEEVFAFVPPNQRLERFGFAADRQTVLNPELSQYRILHFATHGILDSQRPERSGMILSVFNDRGEPQRSLLSPSDVFNLKLSADLVVLSGCRTGLGTGTKTEVKGEGLIGLTGSFLYAGAEQVVASLWSVDDVATNELMKRFYNGIFTQKLTPAAALRDAQRSLSQDPQWQAPYYWAGFILQGDWQSP